MATWEDLRSKLVEVLGSENVYYQPPASIEMKYPAIRFSKKNVRTTHANDSLYTKRNCYELVVIDRSPDSPVPDKLLGLPYCSYDRHYPADNLHHDVLTIYY